MITPLHRVRARRARRPGSELLLNIHLTAWLGRRLVRMRCGRAPWQRTVVLRPRRR